MTSEIKRALEECVQEYLGHEKIHPSHVRSIKLSIMVLMAGKGYVPKKDEERKEWLDYLDSLKAGQ